jgi:predicted amidohydrolase
MESLSNDRPFRADLVVCNATLVRAPGAVLVPGATIVIRDGLISDGPAPAGAQELDAAGAVVTAGFWNCHVHLTEPVWSGAARKPAAQLQPALDDMFNSRGFTSVVDLGSSPLQTAQCAGGSGEATFSGRASAPPGPASTPAADCRSTRARRCRG